jgi:uncharacterized protein DUF6378
MSVSKLDRIVRAATNLYRSGRWRAVGLPAERQAQMWAELRDALGLEPGQSPGSRAGEGEVDEALSLVYGDRQGDYGTPRQNYEAVAKVWSGIIHHKLKSDLTPEECVLLMTGLKVQREAHKPKRDNVVDLHGYGVVLSRVKENR